MSGSGQWKEQLLELGHSHGPVAFVGFGGGDDRSQLPLRSFESIDDLAQVVGRGCRWSHVQASVPPRPFLAVVVPSECCRETCSP